MFALIFNTNIMIIKLKNFGTTLTSRQLGRESFLAIESSLERVSENEEIIINFDEVTTFSPSWGDEFLTPLLNLFKDRLILKNTNNASVKATISLLEKVNKIKFNPNQ